METRKLGAEGLEVSALGLGCMGMSEFYGAADEAEAIATIHRALELGVTFLDTADMYGPFTNERACRQGDRRPPRRSRARDEVREHARRCRASSSVSTAAPSTSARPARRRCERLGVETIDLYYQHRVDLETPIEETVGAMAELVQEGKVRYLGLSEAAPDTIRRAHAVHPISALQTEYSLWSRDPEAEILPTVRELGIGFVAYSPLGRGFLTGAHPLAREPRRERLPPPRPSLPGRESRAQSRARRRGGGSGAAKGAKPSQVALAWVLSRGDDVVPIPGTKRRSYLEENAAAAEIELTAGGARPARASLSGRSRGRRPLPRHVDRQPVASGNGLRASAGSTCDVTQSGVVT